MPTSPFSALRSPIVVDPSKSIADQIYETLRNAIVRREIEPNQRLFEVEVARGFNASRTPVREAFRRLEQDGVAERLAQGGIRVSQPDTETIRDLFNLRAILEVHAIELACERITAEDIALLKQIRAQAEELLKASDVSHDFTLNRFYELNSMFHDAIYAATRSKFLIKVLNNIRVMVMSVRSVSIRLESIRGVLARAQPADRPPGAQGKSGRQAVDPATRFPNRRPGPFVHPVGPGRGAGAGAHPESRAQGQTLDLTAIASPPPSQRYRIREDRTCCSVDT